MSYYDELVVTIILGGVLVFSILVTFFLGIIICVPHLFIRLFLMKKSLSPKPFLSKENLRGSINVVIFNIYNICNFSLFVIGIFSALVLLILFSTGVVGYDICLIIVSFSEAILQTMFAILQCSMVGLRRRTVRKKSNLFYKSKEARHIFDDYLEFHQAVESILSNIIMETLFLLMDDNEDEDENNYIWTIQLLFLILKVLFWFYLVDSFFLDSFGLWIDFLKKCKDYFIKKKKKKFDKRVKKVSRIAVCPFVYYFLSYKMIFIVFEFLGQKLFFIRIFFDLLLTFLNFCTHLGILIFGIVTLIVYNEDIFDEFVLVTNILFYLYGILFAFEEFMMCFRDESVKNILENVMNLKNIMICIAIFFLVIAETQIEDEITMALFKLIVFFVFCSTLTVCDLLVFEIKIAQSFVISFCWLGCLGCTYKIWSVFKLKSWNFVDEDDYLDFFVGSKAYEKMVKRRKKIMKALEKLPILGKLVHIFNRFQEFLESLIKTVVL